MLYNSKSNFKIIQTKTDNFISTLKISATYINLYVQQSDQRN